MKIIPSSIPDVLIIEPEIFEDERGFFMETYQTRRFADAGMSLPFVQDNHSGSRRGTLRGLHYQIQQPQGKLVRVVTGVIFDVAVDLRRQSLTFGEWVGVHLSSENRRSLWIPPGFAHGFYVLSAWAEVAYKVTDFFAPQWDRTLLWNDPKIAIAWPLMEREPPLLSTKDREGKTIDEADVYENTV
jgi:dTDP-4-dehydrorhamnose 3,5-epimerase